MLDTFVVSPRLTALRNQLETLERFWHEVEQTGTPLVETLDHDATHMLVTFLWREHEPVDDVTPYSWFMLDSDRNLQRHRMERLAETDLWYRSYLMPADTRATYKLLLNDTLGMSNNEIAERFTLGQLDPLNPAIWPHNPQLRMQVTPSSLLELPHAASLSWTKEQMGIQEGKVEQHHIRSNLLDSVYDIHVYIPPSYQDESGPYRLLLLFDGWAYVHLIELPAMLDNMVAQSQLPPLVAIMVTPTDQRTRERDFSCNPTFIEFIRQELLPWVHDRYVVTSDPAKTAVGGAGAGGLAAVYTGFSLSAQFGNIIAQSGNFWWRPVAHNEQEWLTHQLAQSPRLPLHFALDVGIFENNTQEGLSPLVATRHLRDVLQARGYPIHYAEFSGGPEYICWQSTLPGALQTLFTEK